MEQHKEQEVPKRLGFHTAVMTCYGTYSLLSTIGPGPVSAVAAASRSPDFALQDAADNLLEGLSIALQHPHLSTHPKVLCAAARVCKGWRQAVQQCSGCSTAVVLEAAYLDCKCDCIQSFGQWVPRHFT
jgi:hypothetical protein